MWHVKIDLAYKVAYLEDEQGVAQAATSGVSPSIARDTLTAWGYEFAPDSAWEIVDILNAIDAVRRPVVRAVG